MTDLQTQLAFQEDALQQLNDVVSRQQQEILVLGRQLALIKQRQDEQAARHDEQDVAEMPANEKPPHY